jgi:VWFA-related protein
MARSKVGGRCALRGIMANTVRALVLSSILLLPNVGYSQELASASAPDVRLANPGGRTLQINQIDTSNFPKVNIFALVTENDQPVEGLAENDFKVREDEVPQEPITVAAQVQPLSVVVALDTSGSMTKAIGTARDAASSFVDRLGSSDSVGVIGFSRTVSLLAPVGSSKQAAKDQIGGLIARGDTALFDAIYASLDSTRGRSGRRAVVLLSDGVDDDGYGNRLSRKTIGDIAALSKELNVPVFTIGLGSEIDEATLKQVASESGGAYFAAPTPQDLQALYTKLGRQLSGQYHISYNSNLPGDGSMHTIQLLQGQLRSAKGYQSPANGVKGVAKEVVAPVIQPEAKVPQKFVEVVAGDRLETAPVVPLNTRLLVTIPGKDTMHSEYYLAFTASPSSVFTVGARASEGGSYSAYLVLGLFGPNTSKLKRERSPESDGMRRSFISGLSTATSGGVWRVSFEGFTKYEVFIAEAGDVGDMGTATDAPNTSDEGAMDLQLNSPGVGHAMSETDEVDRYKVVLPEAGEYQVRLRPDSATASRITLYDDEGNNLDTDASNNAGAGVTLKVNAEGRRVIFIETIHNTADTLGSYGLVVGPAGIDAPQQPKRKSAPTVAFE